MFYFQTGLLTAQSQLLLCHLPSFPVPEKLTFPKLLSTRLPSPSLPPPQFPSRLWTCHVCHVSLDVVRGLPAALGAAGSVC